MKRTICVLFLSIITLVAVFNSTSLSSAAEIDLAQTYAPIFYFEGEEQFYPVDVSYHIENSYLYQYGEETTILINESPTAEELSLYSTSNYQYCFLDNQQGSTADQGILNDYKEKSAQLGYTIYARIYETGSHTIIQYWMFYAFNQGTLNIHEGDWEMIQLVLKNDQPTEVMYSQHFGGQKATWNQVERDGNHVKVYVARGSHANYLRSYSGVFGAASDRVGSNGKVLKPDDYTLSLLEDQAWLDFAGKWGEYTGAESIIRGEAGPYGPKHYGATFDANNIVWNDPIQWGAGLSSANDLIFLLEFFMYNFIIIFILLTLLSLGITFFFIYRRHKKYGLGPRKLSILYVDGLNLQSIGNILCIVGIVIAIASLFSQWYSVSMDIEIPGNISTGLVDMIVIDGLHGIQVNLLGSSGALTQMGSFTIPFSLLIGLGLFFLILGTIGIAHSKKLGKKYITRGFRLVLIIIVILLAIISLGFIGSVTELDGSADQTASDILTALSSQPFGGKKTIEMMDIPDVDAATVQLQWGLGFGGQLLILAGSIIILAGILLILAKTTFFESKFDEMPKKKPTHEKSPEREKDEEKEIKE